MGFFKAEVFINTTDANKTPKVLISVLEVLIKPKKVPIYGRSEVSIKNGHVLRDTLRLRYLKKDVEPMKEKQTRKRLDAQTKEYILKSVLEDGAKVSDLAFKFEIGSSTIHKWIKDYRESKNQDVTRYFTSSEVDKLQAAFDKKLRDLEEENEILKKAMHIFAKNPE